MPSLCRHFRATIFAGWLEIGLAWQHQIPGSAISTYEKSCICFCRAMKRRLELIFYMTCLTQILNRCSEVDYEVLNYD